MLAAKGLEDARRQPALRIVARGIPYHLFFVRQLRIEQQRIVPMKALTCHIPAFCPLAGPKHRIISSVGVLIPLRVGVEGWCKHPALHWASALERARGHPRYRRAVP